MSRAKARLRRVILNLLEVEGRDYYNLRGLLNYHLGKLSEREAERLLQRMRNAFADELPFNSRRIAEFFKYCK